MTVWAYILLGIGGIIATIATTPLWVHVMARPKVRLVGEPIPFWSMSDSEEDQPNRVYVGVHLSFQNDGNEESHITSVKLDSMHREVDVHFSFTLLTPLRDNGRIAKNGGQFEQRLVFSREDPGGYKRNPHSRRPIPYLIPHFPIDGRVKITPSQNQRLLWGVKTMSEEIEFEYLEWDEFSEWLEEAGVALS